MFHAILINDETIVLDNSAENPKTEELIFSDIKKALEALKKYKGSRMKRFSTYDEALDFLKNPRTNGQDISFCDLPDTSTNSAGQQDLVASFKDLSVNDKTTITTIEAQTTTTPKDGSITSKTETVADEAEPSFPSAKPPLLNNLRRRIEAGDYEAVENIIWSNPRCLINCCDSAVYLMAGPKYNACHISARANKPDIMALILDTVTNFKFLRKLYPNESDDNLQDRVNHLLDSYLNTPDPRQGNTPLHFACKLGHYKVVRVLLTFEGCDLTLRDSSGLTAEESACTQFKKPSGGAAIVVGGSGGDNSNESDNCDKTKQKIIRLFKHQLHMPTFRDQLRKRLTMERRRVRANSSMDSSMDTSFSDIDDSFILNKQS